MNEHHILHGVQMDRNIECSHDKKNDLYFIWEELMILSTIPEDTAPYQVKKDLNWSLKIGQKIT